MLLQLIKITNSEDKGQIESLVNSSLGGTNELQSIINWFTGINGGQFRGLFNVYLGAVQATATLTVSSTGSANNDTCVIANVTFTAKTSGATGNQFNISATPATQAANMAAAFNASSNLSGIVTAAAVSGVVTLTSITPGLLGNGLQISNSLTNVALSAFAGGLDGDTSTIDKR